MDIYTLLNVNGTDPVPLFEPEPGPDNTVVLDLSVTNRELHAIRIEEQGVMYEYIKGKMKVLGALYGFGGYLEDRALYHRSPLFRDNKGMVRSIHLGVDIWAAADTQIRLPLDGKIHSFRDNDNYGDYGPTLVFEHEIAGQTFYTLYGHLTRSSIKSASAGMHLKAGSTLGSIGHSFENGDWPPHLHFQLISDMAGMEGDFPGVCIRDETGKYSQVCPDPSFFFRRLSMPQKQ